MTNDWRKIVLVFSLPPVGLRRNHEVNRYKVSALKDAYSLTMYDEWMQQARRSVVMNFGRRCNFPIDANLIWKQCGEGDTDNCLAALKPLFDNLGCAPVTKAGASRFYLGVYESDSQIKRITVERVRVNKRQDERVEVVLTRREAAP